MGLGRNLLKKADHVRTSFAWQPVPTIDRWDTLARVTVSMLPDVTLIVIFDYYVFDSGARIDEWCTLVHVCRKWRDVVFGSPRRLNLRLLCQPNTPVRETLDVWPSLPIVVVAVAHEFVNEDNIIAALEHNERIHGFTLAVPDLPLGVVLAMTGQPFPALTCLDIESEAPVIPDSFLGGSAPHLQEIYLDRVPFPGLPKLLLSATGLVTLALRRIPHSGYISPEAMVTCLSSLTSLERLVVEFQSPRSRPGRRPPPPTRTLLPALTRFDFKGVSEYLEEFLARIDIPLLTNLSISFFHQLIFDTPQLVRFIDRAPKFETNDGESRVVFSSTGFRVTFPQTFDGTLEIGIICRQTDWQLSSLAQFCNSSFPQALIPTMEHLYILEHDDGSNRPDWQDDIENSQWLEVSHPFVTVMDHYISREFTPRIAPVLKELVGETVTEVLPALRTLFLEEPSPSGPVQEAIEQFIAARQLASRPITVSHWDRKRDKLLEEQSEEGWLEDEELEEWLGYDE